MSKTDLVSQGYFSSESFFQFIPTEDGLKLPAPPLNILTKEKDGSTIYYLEKIDNVTKEKKEFEVDATTFPPTTIYQYLKNYYCLSIMDFNVFKNYSQPIAVPESSYSYIKQLTIHDTAGTIYAIASLEKNVDSNTDRIVIKNYEIGSSGILQFYNNKIFGVFPNSVISAEISTDNYNVPLSNGDLSGFDETCLLKRIEMIITTSDFDNTTLILPEPDLDLITIFGDTGEDDSPVNKKRTFIDNVVLTQNSLTTSSIVGSNSVYGNGVSSTSIAGINDTYSNGILVNSLAGEINKLDEAEEG